MTPALAPAPAARWNTLQILKGTRVLLPAFTALLLIAILSATGVHRAAMQTVGKDAAPSIIHAQAIRAALADMDANAANELLAPEAATSAAAAFDQRRIEAARELVEAAKNITYDAERQPIETLEIAGGDYARLFQQALDSDESNKAAVADRYYRASLIMDGTLLPAADALDKANDVVLEQTYKTESQHSSFTSILVLLAGLVALAALIAAQLFLRSRTGRQLNLLLLLATVVTVALTFYSFRSFSREERQLKIAKEDAFDSLHALGRASSVAYAANSDESRLLLDPAHAAVDQTAFFAKANLLAHLPPSIQVPTLLAAELQGHPVPGFTGYLADELNNITFPGEREAAVRTLSAWENYLAVDSKIRQAVAAGDRPRAIKLCIGNAPGESDFAFNQFDQALQATLLINQRAFDSSVANGFAAVSNLEWIAAIAAALTIALTFFGLAPRIREYE